MSELMDQPERLDLRSHDIAGDKLAQLLELFPEARTEDGQIDFDRLKLALGESVDVGKERYGLTWPGKADCFKTIQTPSLGTLLPVPEESVNWDTTENLIIEGDNLEVLKLLQKSYLGKVKMIYIDPPYNTGNDFIYPDDYSESLKTYLEYTGQVDAEGRKFSTNTDTDGRFHSKWLNMMYPRLYLARNLLRDDGVIFISIDDGELRNLRALCDDIFGEENFVATAVWKGRGGRQDSTHVADVHEYVLAFARDYDLFDAGRALIENATYRHVAADGRGYNLQLLRKWGSKSRREDRPNLHYPINAPDGTHVYPRLPDGRDGRWRWGRQRMAEALDNGDVEFVRADVEWIAYQRRYAPSVDDPHAKIYTTWLDDSGTYPSGTRTIADLFNDRSDPPFEYPKPTELLERLLQIGNVSAAGDIILDFFAGSGTTGHAVLDLNAKDGGARKFILVQLPEPTEREDYQTIAEITKERVRRVITKVNDEKGEADGQDRGFRVFKLAESSFSVWDAQGSRQPGAFLEQLGLHVDNVRNERPAKDVLYELLLKSGYPLSATVESLTIDGKAVFGVADGALLVCLDRELTLALMREVAERKPERFVVLDEDFAGNDQLKANAVQIFKAADVTFRTV